jgi:multiple sugar transport system ATP-binding protein
MTLGSRIAVMRNGKVQQFADPLEVYNNPANKFVAGFIGSPPMNFIEGKIIERGGVFYFSEGYFEVALPRNIQPKLRKYKNKEIIFGIRPENVYDKLFSSFPARNNVVRLKCEVVEPMGASNHLYLNTPKSSLIACVEANDRPNVGEYLEMVFDMQKAHFFDKDTEETIV